MDSWLKPLGGMDYGFVQSSTHLFLGVLSLSYRFFAHLIKATYFHLKSLLLWFPRSSLLPPFCSTPPARPPSYQLPHNHPREQLCPHMLSLCPHSGQSLNSGSLLSLLLAVLCCTHKPLLFCSRRAIQHLPFTHWIRQGWDS